MTPTNRASPAAGFTLLEVTIAAAFMIPILFAMVTMGSVVSKGTAEVESRATVEDAVRRATTRISTLTRSASQGSVRVQALADDGAKGIVKGDWILPETLTQYDSLRFQTVKAAPTVSSPNLDDPVTVRFVMDANETDNDVDDDGDGLIDEGRLLLEFARTPPITVAIATGVEECTFAYADGAMNLTLKCALRRKNGHVDRVQVEKTYYLRNP